MIPGLMGPNVQQPTDKPMIDAPSFVKTPEQLQELAAWLTQIVQLFRAAWEKEQAQPQVALANRQPVVKL